MTQAIGILELTSIARGMELGDVMLKSANVQLLLCRTLCPGKFLLMLGGDVGAVQQAIAAGTARAGEMLVDSLVLANIHPSVLPAISGLNVVEQRQAAGDRRNLERGSVHQRRRPRGESGQRHPGAHPYGVWYRRQVLHGGGWRYRRCRQRRHGGQRQRRRERITGLPGSDPATARRAVATADGGIMEPQTPTERMIQEYVPGKQVTLAHLIANPGKVLFKKLGLPDAVSAIGILTITPSEASIIACDIATKSGAVEIGFLDRFTGAVVLTGDVSAVEYALRQVTRTLGELMRFTACPITRT